MGLIQRRLAILVSLAVLGAAAAVSWPTLRNAVYASLTEAVHTGQIDAPAAFAQASDGALILVDIRTPREWAATGVPQGAVLIDMRRADFVDALRAVAGGEDRRIAVICARGVRSAATSNRLLEAGFTQIIDVPEGLMGSRAGPGWIARGLPLSPCTACG